MINRDTLRFVVVLFLGTVAVQNSFSLGIRQPEQGAAATGQNDAFVAQADNPSAIYYNPAGLTQITGTDAMIGATTYGADATYKGTGDGAANGSKETQDQINVLPHFYAVSDFGIRWFRAGIGVYTPFGQSIDWGNNNTFRYVTTRASLQMVNINPTVAFRAPPTSRLAWATIISMVTRMCGRRFRLWVPARRSWVRATSASRDTGTDTASTWAVCGRSIRRMPLACPTEVRWLWNSRATPKSATSPGSLGWAISRRITPGRSLIFLTSCSLATRSGPRQNGSSNWMRTATHWDVTNSETLKSKGLTRAPLFVPQSQLKTKLNWEDSWIVELGTQYEVKNNVFLRAGWYWSENSVPERNLVPTVADSNRIGFSAGLGYKCKSWTIDVAYQFNLSLDRTVKNDVGSNPFPPVNKSVDGQYQSYSQGGAVSMGYHF